MRLRVLALFAPVISASCGGGGAVSSSDGGSHPVDASGVDAVSFADAGLSGLRIAQVQDPASPDHDAGQYPLIASAVVTWLDTFDETGDGKSVGLLYIQDPGSQAPYAGISVFANRFGPLSHTATPGDVAVEISMGQYLESANDATATFDPGTFLPGLLDSLGTYRSTTAVPNPVTLTVSDLDEASATGTLDGNFASGRKWIGMLATINDVTVGPGTAAGGRVTYIMTSGGTAKLGSSPSIDNELYDLAATDFPAGTHFTSVTGIMTWFYAFHIAPRSAADLVL
jgi:hypothetical protein